jgi:hypothetical protein
MADLTAVIGAGLAAGAAAAAKVRKSLDRTTKALAVAAGTVAASLSELNNFGVDPQLISRITSAASNHGMAAADLLAKLPGELEHYGTAMLRSAERDGRVWMARTNPSPVIGSLPTRVMPVGGGGSHRVLGLDVRGGQGCFKGG